MSIMMFYLANPHWLAIEMIKNHRIITAPIIIIFVKSKFYVKPCGRITQFIPSDGIQFDDRLPAAPANSGYDLWTIKRINLKTMVKYCRYRDSKWFKWRINKLNSFAKILTEKIKSMGIIWFLLSNIYPWSYENLMQDWPTWIKENDVDILNVQS